MPTPAIRITDKPVSTPGDQTHFLVTQPELPEGYTPTGEETDEELAALKVESLREIDVNSLIGFINRKPVEFTEASERENVASGEAPLTLFGKIKKWFSDLKAAAFCSVANNLTTNTAGSVLDARQGKALNDLINSIQHIASSGYVDIKSYTLTNMYTFPSDGYVYVDSGGSAVAGTHIWTAVRTSNNINCASINMYVQASYQTQSIFVRKGMKFFVNEVTATNSYSIGFIPLDQ